MTVFINPTSSVSRSGTLANPFRSWADVPRFVPGETYLQCGGTSFDPGPVAAAIQVNESGTPDAPIRFGSYDAQTGDPTILKAWIVGGTRYGINIAGSATDIDIEHLGVTKVGGDHSVANFGITTSAASDSAPKRIRIRHVEVCDLAKSHNSTVSLISLRGADNEISDSDLHHAPDDAVNFRGQRLLFKGNRVWRINTSGKNWADCLQGNGDTSGVQVIDNHMDGSTGSGKQVVILTNDPLYAIPTGGLVEGNTLIGGANTQQCLYTETAGMNVRRNSFINGLHGVRSLGAGSVIEWNWFLNFLSTAPTYKALWLEGDGQTAQDNWLAGLVGIIPEQTGIYAEHEHAGHVLMRNDIRGFFRGFRIGPNQVESGNIFSGCQNAVMVAGRRMPVGPGSVLVG